jgi:hypothetical protein
MDGTIIPNNALANLPMSAMGFGGGAGGGVVNIDMRGSFVTDEDGFVRKVAHAVNKGARVGLVNR